jgi:hypothetical protein
MMLLKFKSDEFMKLEKEGNILQLLSFVHFGQIFNFVLKVLVLLHKLKKLVIVSWRLKFDSFISENISDK